MQTLGASAPLLMFSRTVSRVLCGPLATLYERQLLQFYLRRPILL